MAVEYLPFITGNLWSVFDMAYIFFSQQRNLKTVFSFIALFNMNVLEILYMWRGHDVEYRLF
jgi:hypothetical protein